MTGYRMVMHAIGGPEVIVAEPLGTLMPGPGEAVVRHAAVGLNFIDTYRRAGLYPVDLPAGLGTEASGTVEAIGDGVTAVRVGDRVAYATGPLGAYATARVIPAEHLVAVPDAVDYAVAAAGTLKGMTACFLVEDCARVQPGQTVLVHAAAGGVGAILVQWLVAAGATVIAHTGSAAKAEMARTLGASHALHCPMDELAAVARELTEGRGVDHVFDGVGAASWTASLGAVASRGLLVSYGNASGAVPAFDALTLMRAGSIFVTRPTLGDYAATPAALRALAARVFGRIASGDITVPVGQRFPLAKAAEAHRRLEARATLGATVLTIDAQDG